MCARKARRWSLGSWPNLICDLRPIISARLERVAGIEPARSAWEADRLPLHHTRTWPAVPGAVADLVVLILLVNGVSPGQGRLSKPLRLCNYGTSGRVRDRKSVV